jgi:hypothetical protein
LYNFFYFGTERKSMKRLFVLSAALLAAASVSADFEGVLHMKATTPQGAGTMKLFLSPEGVRSEMDMKAAQPIRVTTLLLYKNPDVVYTIDDKNKTYSEMNLKQMAPARGAGTKYTVKDMGQENVQGYKCRRVIVSGPGGGESELWTTREIMGYGDFAKASRAAGVEGEAYMKALKDAGADGFPVKSIHRAGPGSEVITELVRAEKRSLDDSLFRVPSGYAKAGGVSVGTLSPEAKKALEQRMKNLPPEQREMMEKMMNSGGGGK